MPEDRYPSLSVGSRPFENRIKEMFHEAGGRSPRTGIWIVGHLADFGEDYPTNMMRLYDAFLQNELGKSPIQQSTFYRYLSLLDEGDRKILVQSRPKELTVQEQVQGGKFSKNHYRVADRFPTEWASEEPDENAFAEELEEPIPDVLLDPWE